MRATVRGQTLIMVALLALLMTLMVMMTISIGTKVKEKMELQTMSDSAAYSQAVVTARTYNSVSVLNRAGIAYVVGALAVQSLVSWSTYIYVSLQAAQNAMAYWNQALWRQYVSPMGCCPLGGIKNPSGCTPGVQCPYAGMFVDETYAEVLFEEEQRDFFEEQLDLYDALAADELNAFINSAGAVHIVGQLPVYAFQNSFMLGQSGIDKLVDEARKGDRYSELMVDGKPDGVNSAETNPLSGAMLPLNPIWWHHAFAANGSRLHPFLTSRGGGTKLAFKTGMMLRVDPLLSSQTANGAGAGYTSLLAGPLLTPGLSLPLGLGPFHGSNMIFSTASRFFSADDHSTLRSTFIPPPPPVNLPFVRTVSNGPIQASVYSGQGSGGHMAGYGVFPAGVHILRINGFDDPVPIVFVQRPYLCLVPHMVFGALRAYPWFLDYNFVNLASESNIYGQPKNYNVVKRDLSVRPAGGADQWNPLFRFGFTSTGSKYDNRGIQTRTGTDISKQIGFSTGVTYYHRGFNNAAEPPNFFNPFWRAGLTRANIDDANLGDVSSALGSYPAAMDAFNGLKSAGFQGWQ